MKSHPLTSVVRVLILLGVTASACALAEDHRPVHFSGLINDYSPAGVKGGPWEMHGQWTLELRRDRKVPSGIAADFSADMTMSDYGMTTAGAIDPTQAGQNAHTHHIRLTKATIVANMDGCPTFSPATTTGFQLSGTVSLMTGNGGIALFETNPPSSTLQVCVTGAAEGPYSIPNTNLTMVFVGPATKHFGTQAIHGVVRELEYSRQPQRNQFRKCFLFALFSMHPMGAPQRPPGVS